MPTTPGAQWSRCPFCGTRLDPTQTSCRQCGAAPPAAVTVGYDERRPTTPAELQALETELRDALAPRLQLLRLLGQGGMGSVFLARDPALRRLVVVKVLSPAVAHDPVARARFAREAETAASVAHPNVVHVYQVGTLDRSATTYFTMQFVDGMTLEQAFPPGTPVPEPVAKRIVGEIASALAAAHARELIHRDIKPANVMIDRESGRAVVLDFGISAARGADVRSDDPRMTMEGMVLGTPAYMSPEQAAGEPSIDRSDIYALGVVAFELVTGRYPFTGKTPMALVAAHISDTPPPVATIRPELDPQFATLIDQCLRKVPTERPSAESIARYLAPPSQARLEWPPPGLETLHGKGWRYLRFLATGSLMAVGFLLLLSSQPNGVTGAWNRHDLSFLWELSGSGGIGGFHFLLFILVVSSWVLFLMVLIDASSIAGAFGRARRAGYPWEVAMDVAGDHFPATGDLLNRQGAFALLDPARASILWHRRRWRTVCQAAAIISGYLLIAAWWTGALTVPGEDPIAVVSDRGVTMILGLPLVLLLAGWLLGMEERSILRRARRSTPRLRRPPLPRHELVAAWLGDAGHAEPPRHRFPTAAVLPITLTGAVAVLVVFALMSWANISYVFTWSYGGQYTEESAKNFLTQFRAGRDIVNWWPRVAAALSTAEDPHPVPGDSGRAAARLLLAIGFSRQIPGAPPTPPGFWALDPTPVETLRARYPAPAAGRMDGRLWTRLPAALPDATIADLERRAGSVYGALGATLARARPLPQGWAVDLKDTTLAQSLVSLPSEPGRRTMVERTLSEPLGAFEAAALLAVIRGDRPRAVAAVDLASSYTLMLLQEPALQLENLGLDGITRVQRMAASVGARFHEPRMLRLGQDLDQALAERRATTTAWGIAEAKLMADPETPAGFPALAERRISPAIRLALFDGILSGFCQNPRELLFGISPQRDSMLGRAASVMRDIPQIDELVGVERRRYARIVAMGRGARNNACLDGRF